ncbi:cellulose synthase family protein [Tumidithrix helvetica PCC 7403]|uniref:cellulose synthase family protein n=1 Tax=Tumidithrix helvetica TaxID=3457545 RepID=UPI003C8B3E16
MAAGWLLLYGVNAYWLTAVRNQRNVAQRLLEASMKNSAAYAPERDKELVATALGRLRWNKPQILPAFQGDLHIPEAHEQRDLPIVTVQLPIFNERYVARRLIDAICLLDYPRDRLYIQVLDDSTDDTQTLLQETVKEYQNQGIWVEYIHRTNRSGFKAGALQAAMPLVQGDYIAIFDADFVPSPDWLRRTIVHYCEHPNERIAVVQTRWGHLNSEYSLLTKLQSAGIDGHFAIEQQARCQNGYFLNFNGTAGIWSKQAILDSGGWHADTLAEDMDLSYRAQLKGWRVVYDNDIVAPAELPVAMAAFKLQQFRWAKGSIQCAKKLLVPIWSSEHSLAIKFQSTLHLTGYSVHPLMLLLILISVPLMLITPHELQNLRSLIDVFWATFMLPATFGPPYLYFVAQRQLYPATWRRRFGRILLLAILGTGISWSNTRAVFAGLFNTGANFRRTPKFDIKYRSDRWDNKAYKVPLDTSVAIELSLCAYSFLAVVISASHGFYITLPFMVLYTLSYGYVGGLTLWQTWQQNHQIKR